MNTFHKKLIDHYEGFWNSKGELISFNKGPIHELPEYFSIMRIAPTKDRNIWIYSNVGMSWKILEKAKIELFLLSPYKDDSIIELLTVICHYHHTGPGLNWLHTINFGRPWLSDSLCCYGLLSLPYLYGPKLENFGYQNTQIRCLWLLPITKQEVEFRKKHGTDELEKLFEDKKLDYLNPHRESIV